MRVFAAGFLLWAGLVPVSAQTTAGKISVPDLPYRTGQVIALSERGGAPGTMFFEGFTGSPYGHVGVLACEGPEVYVYHAVSPAVQKVSLKDFLLQASGGDPDSARFTLAELARPLSSREEKALVAEMESSVGNIPYNYSMVMNDCSANCSEFVHKEFAAIGREGVGEPEPLANMNKDAFGGLLAEAWERATGQPLAAQGLGLSPAAVINSPALRIVHEGLVTGRLLSDLELFRLWKHGDALERFAQFFHLSAQRLSKAARSRRGRSPYREYPSGWRR
ncbi:MAG: YiiX/YebB-like N1pC/P60 family cysteine hydrolase [Elusimicrobiota bacterium]|jgi:hypothetical protein